MLDERDLADHFEILNFGQSGRAVTKTEDIPDDGGTWVSYWDTCDYHQVIKSEPDAVVFMLGTNDLLHPTDLAQRLEVIKKGYLALT